MALKAPISDAFPLQFPLQLRDGDAASALNSANNAHCALWEGFFLLAPQSVLIDDCM